MGTAEGTGLMERGYTGYTRDTWTGIVIASIPGMAQWDRGGMRLTIVGLKMWLMRMMRG